MKRINKFISIILLIAIMLPGIVEAGNMDTNEGLINNGVSENDVQEEVEVKLQTETEELEEKVQEEVREEEKLQKETQTRAEEEEVEKKSVEKTEVLDEIKVLSEEPPLMNVKASLSTNAYIERIDGRNRVETAIKVSREAYKGQVKTVLLAGYDGQADALTATFVAGQEDAPLLLTYKDRLDPELLKRLEELNPNQIVILGGGNVVNKNVENGLKDKGFKVTRIEGSSRIETAINVASDYYDYKSGLSGASEVFVIEYDSLVDALAIGPVAARDGIPILIIRRDSVPEKVEAFLREQEIKKVTIVGGEAVVSKSVESQLKAMNISFNRISGDNRIKTSINICEQYFAQRDNIVVANGHRYTDALIGGYFAAKKDAPIILTNEGQVTNDALHSIEKVNVKSYILGGESIISANMFNIIREKVDPTYTLPVEPKPEPELKPGQRKKYSTTADLNMRAGIGVSHQILLTIPKAREVSFISKHDDWSKVKYDNKEGYVSNRYIKTEIVSEDEPIEKPEVPKPGQAMVCLDYGHGGSDPGAVLRDSNGKVIRNEKDDTIRTGKLVAKELRRHGVLVDETRTGDEYVSLTNRAGFANKKDYNYFVSFHRNSFGSDKANGVEGFTTSTSGAKSLAKSVQKNLVDVGFLDRGTKYSNFTVISATRAPALLLEIGFISNAGDNVIYDTKQNQIVKAVTSAILGELGIRYKN